MASKPATRLKLDWMEMPVEFFEMLTFGQLRIGQKFIILPMPGDNEGHGGFKKVHFIFTKTHLRITAAGLGLSYGIPTGRAVNNIGMSSDFPHSEPIILVD